MKCLDTTYLIELIRDPESIAKITRELERRDALATTLYNVFEAFSGAYVIRNRSAGRKIIDKLERALVPIQILPFDLEDATKAAEICGTLKRKGKIVGPDAITAAIALNKGCDGIVSRNKAHFEVIEKATGLKLVEY